LKKTSYYRESSTRKIRTVNTQSYGRIITPLLLRRLPLTTVRFTNLLLHARLLLLFNKLYCIVLYFTQSFYDYVKGNLAVEMYKRCLWVECHQRTISLLLSRDSSLARLHSAALAVVRCLVTFVYWVETAKDTATVERDYSKP